MTTPGDAGVSVNPPDANAGPAKSSPSRPSDRRGFEIAIICALTIEADAIEALFDHHWEDDGPPFDKEPGDPNAYSTGVIGRFNVVLAYMPGMGKVNAATVAANCGKSFPSVKLALVVGICGIVPFTPTEDEIILGDVIISNGVIQYDFGRQLPERLVRRDTLLDVPGRPNLEIRGVLAKLKALRHRRQLGTKIEGYMDVLRQDEELHAQYPGSEKDKLFEATYRHTDDQKSCEQLGCNGELVSRSRLSTTEVPPKPAIHFGLMASGDVVMKSGEDRDRIASTDNVIAFEMEGAVTKTKLGSDMQQPRPQLVRRLFWAFGSRRFLLERRVKPPMNTAASSRAHYLPLSRNKNFTGRKEIIDDLKRLLFTDLDGQRVALYGLGGMGKTQIAIELAHVVKREDQYGCSYSVIWMPALSMASFEQACTKMISEFGIEMDSQENPKDAFKRYLSSDRAGKWFLIIDNADNMEVLYGTAETPGGIDQFIPDCEHGSILFTTRSREVAVSAAQKNILKLSEMDDEDAKALLRGSLIEKEHMQDMVLIDKLLQELTYLPLAITQASAYMNVNGISVNEYLRLLQNTDQDMVELLSCAFRDSTHYDSSQGAVATTWIISFNQIRALHEDASTILSIISYLEPKAIPRALLPPLGSEQKMTRAIGTLCGYSFLSKRDDGETFDMHSLVHLATQRWNEEERLDIGTQQMAFAHIADVFPYDDWENLAIQADSAEDHPHRLVSQHVLAAAYLCNQQMKEAIKLLEHVVKLKAVLFATLGALFASKVSAHGHVSEVLINDKSYYGHDPTKVPYLTQPESITWTNGVKDNGFVTSTASALESADTICHLNATNGHLTADVAAGTTITVRWSDWPEAH
ncbi:hypothetical protein FGADI_8531 [Fusarium gaditjirri]|uniref:Uncharacterized protein n=1 Tax=Fusarium gaditjirri TaxID=282569 RepID=A0A8H4T251_9HYPO|nr:hypothetical protein FGADI_8531 [Fusarium gaditjirri]